MFKKKRKTVSVTIIDDKMIIGLDRSFEVHKVDPYIKAWLGGRKSGTFIAKVSPTRIDFKRLVTA